MWPMPMLIFFTFITQQHCTLWSVYSYTELRNKLDLSPLPLYQSFSHQLHVPHSWSQGKNVAFHVTDKPQSPLPWILSHGEKLQITGLLASSDCFETRSLKTSLLFLFFFSYLINPLSVTEIRTLRNRTRRSADSESAVWLCNCSFIPVCNFFPIKTPRQTM